MKSDDPPYPHYEGYDLATPAEVRAMRDDIVLTLTNDSKFYAEALRHVKAKNYDALRETVWGSYEYPDKLAYRGEWRAKHLNSAITDDVIQHYMHEVFNCHPGSPEGLAILEQFRSQHPECRGHLAWLESDRVKEKTAKSIEDAMEAVQSNAIDAWSRLAGFDGISSMSKDYYKNLMTADIYQSPIKRNASIDSAIDALRLSPSQWAPFVAPVSPTPQPTKEKQMDIKQNVTLIDGVDASKFTDDQIFNFINTLEAQVENLSKTKNKPQKLKDKIKGVNDQIKVLIELVDSRV